MPTELFLYWLCKIDCVVFPVFELIGAEFVFNATMSLYVTRAVISHCDGVLSNHLKFLIKAINISS